MDIQINTIYLIDAKDLGSKQCRYKIETTGMLPDDQRSEKRRDVAWGNTEPARVGSRSSVKKRPGISDNDEVRVVALTLGNQMNRQKGLTDAEVGLGHGRSVRW